MQKLITAEQAKQVTGGRTPLMPIEYEAAVNALQACITMDDAKYWVDKADALAAWARIYRSDDAGRKARQLKLHAFRRMGQIAEELRPQRRMSGGEGRGSKPGPRSLLQEQGLTIGQANAARSIAKIPEAEFSEMVAQPRPPMPSAVFSRYASGGYSDSWKTIMGAHEGSTHSNSMSGFAIFCRRYSAKEIARGFTVAEIKKVRELATQIDEWLDELEQYLPKEANLPPKPRDDK